MNQPYIYIYPLPFGLPSHWSHHSALSRVPWAPQYVLISCLFYACILSRFSHAQLFATLWTVAHSPGSSVHGIVQARTLEWVTMPFSKGSSQPRDRIHVSCISCIGRLILYHWDTWEAPSKYWKSPSSQSYGFSSSYAWMWEFHYKESWTLKNWCFWTVVLEKTLESPLDCKEIQAVHPKGDQSWVFFGRNDAKAETPILWPPHAKSWLIGKDSDAGRDWGRGMRDAGREGDNRGWDGWMASPTRWTWVWVNSGSWWWTGRPGVLRFMGSQRVGHDWATELNWLMANSCWCMAEIKIL